MMMMKKTVVVLQGAVNRNRNVTVCVKFGSIYLRLQGCCVRLVLFVLNIDCCFFFSFSLRLLKFL